MKTLLITIALLGLTPTERTVYICESKNAVAYHLTKDCSYLLKCKENITDLTETAAKRKGLHLCGWEN